MTPRKPIIYGPDGHPIVRARDRLAPKPRVSAGLEGWVEWRLIDRKGRAVKGGEQHNLILDTYLDTLATWTTLDSYRGPYGTLSGFSALLSHFAVGTSSTPPDVTDAALGAQVGARVTTLIATNVTRVSECVYDFELEREFDFAQGNGNLTEFGFANGASSAILVRELFRDGSGNPITITKTTDYKLRIKYTHRLELGPKFSSPATGSVSIAGIGTVQYDLMWIRGSDPNINSDAAAFGMFAAGRALSGYIQAAGGVFALSTVPTAYNSNVGALVSSNREAARTPDTYVPGSFSRTADVLFPTDQANFEIATIGIGGGTQGSSNGVLGLALVLDSNDRFTKDSLHTLSLDEVFTVSWGRA